jgi:hypothetical protein
MGKNLKVVVAIVMVIGISWPISAQLSDINISGTWAFTVQTEAGTGSPTVTLKHEGEKLTGHYSSTMLGEADLTGSVKGKDLKFTFTANVQGTSLEVTYTGTIENKDTLKGTLDLGGMAQGTFTAKRK